MKKCWTYLLRVLKFCVQTQELCLIYPRSRNDFTLEVYSDADWGSCKSTSRSQSGFAIFFNGLVHWKSSKQKCVSLSTCESEYIAASDAIKTTIPINRSIFELTNLKLCEDEDLDLSPITLFEDNQACIKAIT